MWTYTSAFSGFCFCVAIFIYLYLSSNCFYLSTFLVLFSMCVCVCVFLCAHTLETNEPSESFCSSSDATQWFKEANGADSLAARKVKITILLLKTVYIVAVQVLLSVPAPWLSAESQAPDVKAHQCSEGACFEEYRFIASEISCNGWVRRGGGGDYTDNYKTWECWKQLCVILPQATGDLLVELGKNVLQHLQ